MPPQVAQPEFKALPLESRFVDPAESEGRLRRFSVDEYHWLIETGVLTEDDRVELLEGLIVEKKPEDPIHAAVTYTLVRWFARALPDGWAVRGPAPVTTPDSEPEPDVIIAKGTEIGYADHHPHPDEIAVDIEVANTSLRRDRRLKQRLNARAGIREYWIVNLAAREIERYTDPTGPIEEGQPHYRQKDIFRIDQEIPIPVEGTPPLPVSAIFPPPSATTAPAAARPAR